jgi:hypothetical protein
MDAALNPNLSEPSARKRTRSEVEEVRDSDLYLPDGNVVLAVYDRAAKRTTYFRVLKSLMAKHSPVFGDMFSMPSPPDAEKYDDAHLVCLEDDVNHLRTVLNMLHDPR